MCLPRIDSLLLDDRHRERSFDASGAATSRRRTKLCGRNIDAVVSRVEPHIPRAPRRWSQSAPQGIGRVCPGGSRSEFHRRSTRTHCRMPHHSPRRHTPVYRQAGYLVINVPCEWITERPRRRAPQAPAGACEPSRVHLPQSKSTFLRGLGYRFILEN